jgi:glycerol-3-phosphate dehydrogenase
MPSRKQMWDSLGPEVDLLVIGGGINGVGVARDAVRRGLRVAMVEQGDLASGTSSSSSKLVHGGLRYLEQYEFSLVFEAVSERRTLMEIAPHLVNPLPFLFPVYEGDPHSLWLLNTGMWLYDGLSLFRSPKLHRKLNRREVAREEPCLLRTNLTGAPLYYDCSTDDARLTLETGLDAAVTGAAVVTYARATAFISDESGRVCGAVIEDKYSGCTKQVAAKVVVNATGPWTDATVSIAEGGASEPVLRPTKGVHIVVKRTLLPINAAVVMLHPNDKRVLFAIPWGDCTYIGTTDTDYDGDPNEVYATLEDVDYLLSAVNGFFPKNVLGREHVHATWAGLRPLVQGATGALDASSVSREHRILIGATGLISVAGGKLTTYRKMCEEVVDTAVKMLNLSGGMRRRLAPANTDTEPLLGAIGWPENDDHELVATQIRAGCGAILDGKTCTYLANTYGMRGHDVAQLVVKDPSAAAPIVPGRPEIMACVDWAVREELAVSVEDVLMRRTQIYYRDPDQGLSVADQVAQRMGVLLGWDEGTRNASAAGYARTVAQSRGWRDSGS